MPDRGTALVAAGLVLLAGTLLASAATAPGPDTTVPTGSPDPGDDGGASPTTAGERAGGPGDAPATATPGPVSRGIVVGVQGTGSYTSGGYVARWREGRREWRSSAADTYFDVTRLDDGRVLAAWMSADSRRCGDLPAPCARTGFVVLAEAGGAVETVESFSFPVRTPTNSEVHDVEAVPGGGYVLTDMDRERLLLVRDGAVVWEWRASTVYEPPPDPTRRDWLHLNDVDALGDGRFLVSVRNANQLLVVERHGDGGRVVETVNADRTDADDGACTGRGRLVDGDGDGDVRCGDPTVFREQHNPQWLGNGAVLVADSENDRVVELHRRDGRWRPVWVLSGAAGRPFAWPRDADRLPGGTTLVTDSRGRRVVEVTEDGDVVRQWSTGAGVVYEADRVGPGEPVGGPKYAVRSASGQPGSGSDPPEYGSPDRPAPAGPLTPVHPDAGRGLPVLTDAARLLRAAFPWLPLWVGGVQVGLSAAALALVGVGTVVRWRDRGLPGRPGGQS
jgi:hypothetical protein